MMKSTRTRRLLDTDRRLPVNTIVLPPLEEAQLQILHDVLVNKPKPGSVNSDVVTVGRTDTSTWSAEITRGSDAVRVAQLEQNIRFLQDQHTQMLNGLHKEIDSLRHRNRELQFQLVFTKGGIPSSPSSPEDDTKPKTYLSPKQVNVTPLQVELLEKELGELKLQLQDVDSRNAYLSAIVEEQKKKLERYERDRERELERATQPDPELLHKLDDAEALLRRLRRENSELRRENSIASANPPNSSGATTYQRGNNGQNRSNSGRNHRGNSAGHYRGNWFPPLHAQTYWHGGRGVERNGASGGDDSTTLPSLMPSSSGSTSNGHYQGRRSGNNNNHYNNSGEGRKYKNGQNRAPKPT